MNEFLSNKEINQIIKKLIV